MRWRAARHEPHFVHTQGLGEFLSESQMAEMNRIKCAAENSDGSVHAGASPRARSDKILNRKGRHGCKVKINTVPDPLTHSNSTKWSFKVG